MAKVGLSAPWDIYYKELSALFEEDPEVEIVYDEDVREITLYVDDSAKADALARLLPNEKDFGGVKLRITVVSANEDNVIGLFEKAFSGNPAFVYAQHVDGVYERDYVVLAHDVVQYFADNLADINRNKTTLYENIARHVFDGTEIAGKVSFCTATKDNLITFCDPDDLISLT